jgi:hypothetical protein
MSQFEKIGNIKNKLKKAVVVGATAVAIGGAGEVVGVNEALAHDLAKNKGNISSVENSQSKENKTKREKELLENYMKAKKEVEEVEKSDPKYKKIEKIKNEIEKHIKSREYLSRLKSEIKGNNKLAKYEQDNRIDSLNNAFDNTLFVKKKNLNNIWAKNEPGEIDNYKWVPEWLATKIKLYKAGLKGVAGFYNTDEQKIVLPDEDFEETAQHELLHAVTRGNLDIPQKTKNILRSSYDKLGTSRDTYLYDPGEILVRKQALDLEMEELGIKKYGEKFTREHYDRLMKFYSKNLLSFSSMTFIKIIKPKFEYFEKIFNEIAENESGESSKIEQA